MRNLKIYLILMIIASLFSEDCYSQTNENYETSIATAKQFLRDKKYLSAGKFFSQAFVLNGNRGRVDHRYDAARSWSLGGQSDSAFYQLEKITKGNYSEYLQLLTDTAFTSLHSDVRWNLIVSSIKNNKQKQDSSLNSQFKNLNRKLVAVLDTIYNDDQLIRRQMDGIQQKYGWNSAQMNSHIQLMNITDSVNVKKIKKILDQYGWLGREEVGEQGNGTLFLVIQHADLATQLTYLPIIRKAVAEGKANKSSLALLEDRIALRKGNKQIYGSQLALNNKTGKYYVQPMTDPENVNKRRAEAGLSTINDYVGKWGITWSVKQYETDLISANIKL